MLDTAWDCCTTVVVRVALAGAGPDSEVATAAPPPAPARTAAASIVVVFVRNAERAMTPRLRPFPESHVRIDSELRRRRVK